MSRSHCSQCEHNDEYKKDDQIDSDMVTTLSKEKGKLGISRPFLTYEDMKKYPIVCLTKLAKFLDKPFCLEEEREEVVQEIVRLCSFDNLSSLEVNQTGVQHFSPQFAVENRHFLRKGQVGDWRNHLTLEMAEQLDEITRQKLRGLV
ncbi:hypothetical protein K7X08_024879 [Anisodus acutangulus]|uniref:Sulfotransferase n=1 Tax=Anisodus acutangulus TaxID=402998 RepID=A0A9Q1MBZ5_9SOLA|nr:hypothetical protein K7X08_024879 [Anisodus acutangulus]